MRVEQTIQERLKKAFQPHHLEVHNDSDQHRGGAGGESHFSVIIVSETFVDQSRIARHRALNAALADLLAEQIHALSLHPYTPDEWAQTEIAPKPPECLGGERS